MKKTLIAATVGEVVAVVAVLAGYLIAIARTLRNVSKTLGLVTFGVRAIETQTAPIGPALRDVNGALEQAAGTLSSLAGANGDRPKQDDTGPGDTGTIESGSDVPRPGTP